MVITRKWVVCDVCEEPVCGAIGNDTTAQQARRSARNLYKHVDGIDVCDGCLADRGVKFVRGDRCPECKAAPGRTHGPDCGNSNP